jgi:hypothetical protein
MVLTAWGSRLLRLAVPLCWCCCERAGRRPIQYIYVSYSQVDGRTKGPSGIRRTLYNWVCMKMSGKKSYSFLCARFVVYGLEIELRLLLILKIFPWPKNRSQTVGYRRFFSMINLNIPGMVVCLVYCSRHIPSLEQRIVKRDGSCI